MIKNKKGVSLPELLAYITISGLVISTLFLVLTNAIGMYNRSKTIMDITDSGYKHITAIDEAMNTKTITNIASCKSWDNVECKTFVYQGGATTIKFSLEQNKSNLYINNQKITADHFLIDPTSIKFETTVLTNSSGAYNAITKISFKISQGRIAREFFTTIT